jgi:hypothetical protein
VPAFFVGKTRLPLLPISISSAALNDITCNTGGCPQSNTFYQMHPTLT